MKSIVFVGANELLVDFVQDTAKHAHVTVFEEHATTRGFGGATVVPLLKTFFGIEKILKKTGLQLSLPFYMKGLYKELKLADPDVIVVMDFIRCWYIQTLAYVLFHPHVKLHIYVETQRVPQSFISKVAFYVFFFIYQSFEKRVSSYITYTELGTQFAKKFKIFAPVVQIPVPIRDDIFSTLVKRTDYLQNNTLRILMVARYVEYKNHKVVIDALYSLKEKGFLFKVSFCGRGGDMESNIKEYVKRKGLKSEVFFSPVLSQEELAEIYRNSDVLILPSTYEAIGLSVPEAMASGCATITSDTVGANVYVKDQISGFIVKTGDSASLLGALYKCYEKNKLTSLGESGRKIMGSSFTTPSIVKLFREHIL